MANHLLLSLTTHPQDLKRVYFHGTCGKLHHCQKTFSDTGLTLYAIITGVSSSQQVDVDLVMSASSSVVDSSCPIMSSFNNLSSTTSCSFHSYTDEKMQQQLIISDLFQVTRNLPWNRFQILYQLVGGYKLSTRIFHHQRI